MSWGISIFKLPANLTSVRDLPKDFQIESLGSRASLISRIRELFPDVDFPNECWGSLVRPGYVIEFNMGESETCDDFALRIVGGGDAMAAVAHLQQGLGLRGVDHQTGELFSESAAEDSFAEWQEFRDRALAKFAPEPPNGPT